MRQGAAGHVRLVERDGRTVVEKRFRDPSRRHVEELALRAAADRGLPVPDVLAVTPDAVLMTLLAGERLDAGNADLRVERLRASTDLLRRLHASDPPTGLPPAPDDAAIVRRYRDRGGPPLPLAVPAMSGPPVFCHGDWTDGNLLAVGREVTGIVDWERAHRGDPATGAVPGGVGRGPQGRALGRGARLGLRRRPRRRTGVVPGARRRALAVVRRRGTTRLPRAAHRRAGALADRLTRMTAWLSAGPGRVPCGGRAAG